MTSHFPDMAKKIEDIAGTNKTYSNGKDKKNKCSG